MSTRSRHYRCKRVWEGLLFQLMAEFTANLNNTLTVGLQHIWALPGEDPLLDQLCEGVGGQCLPEVHIRRDLEVC